MPRSEYIWLIWDSQLDTRAYTLPAHAILFTLKCTVCDIMCNDDYPQEKCEQYWPDKVNKTTTIGSDSEFTLTVTSFVPSAEYQIRKIQLKSVKRNMLVLSQLMHDCDVMIFQSFEPERELCVTHMYFTAWPDHGVPRNAMSVISFIRRVRREHPACLDQPLLVHCSAGIGRTGTFILLDMVMQQMKREGTLSVYNHLRNMRGQRMKMVQTQVKYLNLTTI